jgi:benzoyl-CoA reductase/2-hydroxyglutaryl-CoA dehydratase subunit BcrC/BadD/HgdB
LAPRAIASAAESGTPVDLCTYHRAAFGLTREGFYPSASAFVSTSHLCTLAGIMLAAEAHRRAKPFRLIDVPPVFDSEALDYVETQLETLVSELETATGTRYDSDRMCQALRLSNEARTFALELNALRLQKPAPLRGGPMLAVLGLGLWILGHRDGVAHFRAWRDYTAARVEHRDPEQPKQKIRLFWLHLRPYAESGLIEHLENDLGAVIAFEEHNTIWWDELDEERPLRALAAKILGHPSNGSIERRLAMILEGVRRYECDGVVHFSHWGCRQASGATRVIRDRLRREGIPMLELDGDCIDPANLQSGPLRTRIEAFVETLV